MKDETESGVFAQFVVFKLDPAWRQQSSENRKKGFSHFEKILADGSAKSHLYLLSGLKASADLLIWNIAPGIEALQERYIGIMKSPFGGFLEPRSIYTGVTRPSTYTRSESERDFLTSDAKRKKYISFYPFTKTSDWYLLGFEERKRIMSDHIAIGRGFPGVTQTLLYSFGADDQEFLVAYETDDLQYYIGCVMALRESESRRYTQTDTPVYTGSRKSAGEIENLFGGSDE